MSIHIPCQATYIAFLHMSANLESIYLQNHLNYYLAELRQIGWQPVNLLLHVFITISQ